MIWAESSGSKITPLCGRFASLDTSVTAKAWQCPVPPTGST
jgi:hypothetical protein